MPHSAGAFMHVAKTSSRCSLGHDDVVWPQTELQRAIYRDYAGGSPMCVDTTHGIASLANMKLATMLVVVESSDGHACGIPVAHAIISRETEAAWTMFFRAVQEASPAVKVPWIMSDMDAALHNAAATIFKNAPHKYGSPPPCCVCLCGVCVCTV